MEKTLSMENQNDFGDEYNKTRKLSLAAVEKSREAKKKLTALKKKYPHIFERDENPQQNPED